MIAAAFFAGVLALAQPVETTNEAMEEAMPRPMSAAEAEAYDAARTADAAAQAAADAAKAEARADLVEDLRQELRALWADNVLLCLHLDAMLDMAPAKFPTASADQYRAYSAAAAGHRRVCGP